MLLLLHQDFTDMLRDRIFAQCITLANTLAIISNCLRLILEVKAQHFLGFFRSAHFLWMDSGHSTKIVNLFGNNQCMAQLFLGVLFKLGGNVHVFGALEDLRVNNVRDDCLVFASEVLVQESNQIFSRSHGSRLCRLIRSSHDSPWVKLRERSALPLQRRFAPISTTLLQLLVPGSMRSLLFPVLGFQGFDKFVRLVFCHFLGNPVAFLNSSNKLLASSIDDI